MSSRNSITSKQLMIYIISSQLGLGIITLPSQLAKTVGHDGWISTLFGGLFSTIGLVFILQLLKRYSDKSILDINKLLYGKLPGFLLNSILTLYTFFAAVLALRTFGEVIKLTVLRLTPPVILTVFILIPTLYLTWYGLKPICRFSNIIILIVSFELIILFLIRKNIRITFLMPFGESGLLPIIKGSYITVVAYLGLELTSFIYPDIKDKGKVFKYALFANILTIVIYTIIVFVSTGFFGENMLERLTFPLFGIIRSYRAPVVERLDLFFIALWFPAMACTMRSYFFTTYYNANKMFGLQNNKVSFTIFTILSVLLSRIPKDFVEVLRFQRILGIMGICVLMFFPISFLFSFINKRGVKGQ